MLAETKFAAEPLASPALGEPYLLTPGPLTTAYSVKQAMLRDWGSWDGDFRAMTSDMRRRLLALTGDRNDEFDCVPMQGSGSFCVEAMLGSFVPRDGKVLVLANGAYGLRAAQTMQYLGRAYTLIDKGDYLPPRGDEVAAALAADPDITHVIAIHCETSSGILNPVAEIAQAVHAKGRKLLVDSMSAFGAVALDVHAQWAHLNKTGQWRYTPPTHVVAAFLEALRQHEAEGGVAGRGARYTRNRDVMVAGMRDLGFETLLGDRWLSPIIVTFFNPAHANFAFDRFYELMKDKGFIIYPGKLTAVDSFRVGCIGQMDEHVMRRVVEAAAFSLYEMGVDTAAPPAAALAERAKLAA